MLKWLARLGKRSASSDEISLDLQNSWEVDPTSDPSAFLRALSLVSCEGAILYVEGTGEAHVAQKLAEIAVPAQANLARGISWPRPDMHHVPAEPATLAALATFLEDQPAGFAWSHCHLYADGAVLLEWHDAFQDPMYLSVQIAAERVAAFAGALGVSWQRHAG